MTQNKLLLGNEWNLFTEVSLSDKHMCHTWDCLTSQQPPTLQIHIEQFWNKLLNSLSSHIIITKHQYTSIHGNQPILINTRNNGERKPQIQMRFACLHLWMAVFPAEDPIEEQPSSFMYGWVHSTPIDSSRSKVRKHPLPAPRFTQTPRRTQIIYCSHPSRPIQRGEERKEGSAWELFVERNPPTLCHTSIFYWRVGVSGGVGGGAQ